MLQVTTGDQADTPITHIPIGIAGIGGVAIGGIDEARSCIRTPQPESEISRVIS